MPERLERYAFNRLKSTQFVNLGAKGIWAPQTMLVPRAFTGPNLYYRGLHKWGTIWLMVSATALNVMWGDNSPLWMNETKNGRGCLI